MKILVTGSCGFIGYHLCKELKKDKYIVTGIDNFNPYYDIKLKELRFNNLMKENIEIIREDLTNPSIYKLLPNFDIIVHLAAQAGVRYSVINPYSYIQNNLIAFGRLIEFSKNTKVKKFIYASSSSVYGNNQIPWKEDMKLDRFQSLYASTKISNEAIADSYFNMFGLNCIGLRFFTVYGPFGRPDMALWKWTESILNNKPIELYNFGKMERSWTYIDDIVTGIISSIEANFKDHEKFNLGNDNIVNIEYAADYIAKYIGIKYKKEYLEMQLGDVPKTQADLTKSRRLLNFNPKTRFEDGVIKFIDWYKEWKTK